MFCYKCGNQLEDDAVFCPLCGAKNDDEENQPSVKVNDNYYTPPRTKKGVPWKIIIPSAVIAAAVIVVFAFGRNRNVDNISTANINSKADFATDEYLEDTFIAEKTTAEVQITAQTTTQTTATTTTAADEQTIPDKVKIGDETYETSMTGNLILRSNKLTNSDIINLQYMTSITELDLYNNDLTDLSPISNLTNLESLYINKNNISDISPLSNLTNLTVLEIGGNNISDISPLSKLTNLSFLNLSNNSISDISALSELTGLECVYLRDNSISDLTPLSKSKLDFLDASNNSLNGNLQAFRGLDFTGDSDSSFNIAGCGYEKYFLADENGEYYATSDEFDEAIQDNIQFGDKLDLYLYNDGTYWGNYSVSFTNN